MAPQAHRLSPADREAVLALLEDYRDLSPPAGTYRTMNAPPTGIQALRMITEGRPVVIQGFDPRRPAPVRDDKTASDVDFASPQSLISLFPPTHLVSIAITDDGMADSVRSITAAAKEDPEEGDVASFSGEDDGAECFVQPLTEMMSMEMFLDKLVDNQDEEIHYLQSQNGNIYRHSSTETHISPEETDNELSPELAVLQQHLMTTISFMDEALDGRGPDAVNLWIGGRGSRTSLHRDPYENIYHVLSGSKTFTVLSPLEGYLLEPKFYPPATLRRPTHDSESISNGGSVPALEIHPDQNASYLVPWVKADPTNLPPDTPLRPITIRVDEGESLYLPGGWWHWVEQEEGDGGMCVAVNYWYDQTLDSQRYATERFIWRRIGRADMLD